MLKGYEAFRLASPWLGELALRTCANNSQQTITALTSRFLPWKLSLSLPRYRWICNIIAGAGRPHNGDPWALRAFSCSTRGVSRVQADAATRAPPEVFGGVLRSYEAMMTDRE